MGEGVSFREYRGLPDVLIHAALHGVKVVCLAPAAGSLRLSVDDEKPFAALRSLSLKRADVIAEFDKRLDYRDWR